MKARPQPLVILLLLYYANCHVRATHGAPSGTWSTTHFSKNRALFGVASSVDSVMEELLVIAGGLATDGVSNVVDIYNVKGNFWTTSLATFYGAQLATAVQSYSIFASQYGNDVHMFSANMHNWRNGTTPVGNFQVPIAATTVANNLAIFLAATPDGKIPNVLVIYNFAADKWYTSPPCPTIWDSAPAMTSVGNLVLVAGGSIAHLGSTTIVNWYNTDTNSWSSTAGLSVARGGVVATTVGNLAFFAGGVSNNNEVLYWNTVDIYNHVTNTWSVTHLTGVRANMGALSLGTLAMFAGGTSDGVTTLSVVDIYDTATNTWSTSSLSSPRWGVKAVPVGNWACFVGGYNSRTRQTETTVDIYYI